LFYNFEITISLIEQINQTKLEIICVIPKAKAEKEIFYPSPIARYLKYRYLAETNTLYYEKVRNFFSFIIEYVWHLPCPAEGD
jgi:hypothetical protein